MKKPQYPALGKKRNVTIKAFKEFLPEYMKVIEEINQRKNNKRIQELAIENNETVESIKAKLEADKDFRDANQLH